MKFCFWSLFKIFEFTVTFSRVTSFWRFLRFSFSQPITLKRDESEINKVLIDKNNRKLYNASKTKTNTGGEEPHRCPMCAFISANSVHLKQHILVHIGEKPFSCNQSEYKCTENGNLKKHMLTHSGEKPFICMESEFCCARAWILKVHMQKHRGEKPFSCNQCNYKCTQACDLKRHMLMHKEQKPFACNLKVAKT